MRGGTDVKLEQIRAGMAWWYREYAKERNVEDRASYAATEDDARARRVGLWKDVKPVPPWDWRKKASREWSLHVQPLNLIGQLA